VAWDVTKVAELPPDSKIGRKRVRESRSLTAEEAKRFAKIALERRNGLGLVLAMAVGLRPGELTALRWCDLDEHDATITIAQAWKDAGEDRKLGKPKTRRSQRTVGIPDALLARLVEHRQSQREEAVALGWRNQFDLMFVSEAGTALDDANLRRFVRSISDKAGVPRITPCQLRHTAASLLADEGQRIEAVADLLGHASSQTTERYYLHRVKPSVDTARGALDGLLGG
jgi:integrase